MLQITMLSYLILGGLFKLVFQTYIITVQLHYTFVNFRLIIFHTARAGHCIL